MRLATAADEDAVVELTARAFAPYTEEFGYPPIPVTEDYAPRIEAGEVWLLEDGATLAGLIVLQDDAGAPKRTLEIFNVAVAPELKGQGLGTRLLTFAEEQARARGAATLSLYTNARMPRNITLYQRFGFEETGRRRNPQRPGWTRVDMEKRLASEETRRTA